MLKSMLIECLFLFSLLLAFQVNADNISPNDIVGTWMEKDKTSTEVVTYLSNGTWTAKVVYLDLLTNWKKSCSMNGTWKLVDNSIVRKITYAQEAKLKGLALVYKILSITQNEIKFIENGKKGKLTRVKKTTTK